jgi:hypothetical protein
LFLDKSPFVWAPRLRVVALIIRETAVLLVVGIAIGALVSQWVTRAMQGLLFQLSPTDFRTMAAAASALKCKLYGNTLVTFHPSSEFLY